MEEMQTALGALMSGFEEFKAVNDRRMAELERGASDVVTTETVDRINDGIEALSERVDTLNARVEAGATLGGEGAGVREDAAYRNSFGEWFRRGDDATDARASVQAAQRSGFRAEIIGTSDANGGYLTPVEWDRRIISDLRDVSPLRRLFSVMNVSVNEFDELVELGEAGSGWVAEGAPRNETATPTFGSVRFIAHEQHATPVATQRMLDDAAVDIEGWLARKVSEKFTDDEAEAFINGTGSGQPRGILNHVGAANAAAHPLGAIAEETAAGAGAIEVDELLDVSYGLAAKYARSASWMMARSTRKAIRQLKTTDGHYLWQPRISASEPDTLDGYPIEAVEEMPAIGAAATPILFGDFGRAYMILDRIGIRVLRDPYKVHGRVHFYTTRRVGGGLVDPRPVRALTMAAA